MAAQSVIITLDQMDDFLARQGFVTVDTHDATKECVFAKSFTHILTDKVSFILSLRVYTSIINGESRGIGEDAIRVSVWVRKADKRPAMIGASKRVHRVQRWRTNLAVRLANWQTEMLADLCPQSCPKCHSLMQLRRPNTGQHWMPFFGCIEYPACNGSRL